MPAMASVTVPTWFGAIILAVLLVLAFTAGKKEPTLDEERLQRLAANAKAWLKVANKVTGIKAAAYGGLGVVLGAAGGLTADYVTTGDMSLTQIKRGLCVLAILIALTIVIIWAVERFRIVERLLKVPEDSD